MKRLSPRLFCWLFALVLPIFAVYPALTVPIEEHAYDAAVFHVNRAVVFSAARAEGILYPRWVQTINDGLGGPLFNFYAPLPYYMLDVLHNVGIPQPIGWRLLTAAFLVMASTGMFGLGLTLFNRADAALLAAVVFVYNSFLLRDLFERGSPQGWAVALYPWLLWLLLRLSASPSGFRLLFASACWAAIILLHNAAALLVLPIVGIVLLYRGLHDGIKSVALPLVALTTGLLLCAFYLIPYLAESQFVQIENVFGPAYTQPAANPLQVQELFSLSSVFDVGLGNNAIGESGALLHTLVLPLGAIAAVILWRRRQVAEAVLAGSLVLLSVWAEWMQTGAATWVWANLPELAIFQFRWKLLSILALGTGILLGLTLEGWTNRFRGMLIAGLAGIYVISQLPALYPQLLFRYAQFPASPTITDVQADMLRNGTAGLSSYNEFLPRWRTRPFSVEEAERVAAFPAANLPMGARILDDVRGDGWMRVQLETPQPFRAAMHVLYFPGWVGDVDGVVQTLSPMEETGYVLVSVPGGVHTITLRYDGTAAQHVGDWTSILTLGLLFGCTLVWRRKTKVTVPEEVCYLHPRGWLMAGIILLFAVKAFWVDPQTTLFRASSTCDDIPAAQVQASVRFGQDIRLCGYSWSRSGSPPDEKLSVTLYWEIDRSQPEPAFSFVHLLGTTFNPETGNPLWGQQDKQAPGEHPIVDWAPKILYRDAYQFRVDPNAPPGAYQLEIGWQTPEGVRFTPEIHRSSSALSVSHLNSLLISGITIP